MFIRRIFPFIAIFSFVTLMAFAAQIQAQSCGTRCVCPTCTRGNETDKGFGTYTTTCTSRSCRYISCGGGGGGGESSYTSNRGGTSNSGSVPSSSSWGHDGGQRPGGGYGGCGGCSKGTYGGYSSNPNNEHGSGQGTGRGSSGSSSSGASGKGGCFLAGTKVTMADGSVKNIEDVQIGDLILAYDEQARQKVIDSVLQLEAVESDHHYVLQFSDGTLVRPTQQHPFLSRLGWKSLNPTSTLKMEDRVVSQLMIGDEILSQSGQWITLKSIKKVQGTVMVYNLKEVGSFHTFFANGLCVHNKK